MFVSGYVIPGGILPSFAVGAPILPRVVDAPGGNGQAIEGEKTERQLNVLTGVGADPSSNFLPSGAFSDLRKVNPWVYWPPTFRTYRTITAHPTVALGCAMIFGPILIGRWTVQAKAGTPKERIKLIEDNFLPRHDEIVAQCLFSVYFGFQAFEQIWDVAQGGQVISEYKGLLPELSQALVTKGGKLVGINNLGVDLFDKKYLVHTHGDPSPEAGNPYGRSRLENIRRDWSRSELLDDEKMRTAKKIAGIIAMVRHPKGGYYDKNNVYHTYQDAAKAVLRLISNGVGCTLETISFDINDYIAHPELAKLSLTGIDFYDAGNVAEALGGFDNSQRYYDSRIFRGLNRPERSGLEGQSGTKAEAGVHAEPGIMDSDRIHKQITHTTNKKSVNDTLEVNFGADARDTIWLEAGSLVDSYAQVDNNILEGIRKYPALFEEFLTQVNADTIATRRGIPKKDDTKPIEFSGLTGVGQSADNNRGPREDSPEVRDTNRELAR